MTSSTRVVFGSRPVEFLCITRFARFLLGGKIFAKIVEALPGVLKL